MIAIAFMIIVVGILFSIVGLSLIPHETAAEMKVRLERARDQARYAAIAAKLEQRSPQGRG